MPTLKRSPARVLQTGLLLALLAAGCGRRSENLVLVSIDTLRADALGCYGAKTGATPNLDALARDGTVFANTVSPVPITFPAHATILTGLSPARHDIHLNLGQILHPDVETLAERLAGRGFVTAGFVSALVLDGRYGLDQGFGTWDDEMSRDRFPFGAERTAEETVARAIEWLDENRKERFFLFVHLYEPHEPYEPPPEFAARVPGSPYLAEVAAADAAVGTLLAHLEDLDLDGSTVVALVGDHGEMLGEHGEETHTYFVYQGALKVPFLVRPPRRPKVPVVPRLAGLVDVTPTLCGLLGVPPPPGTDGLDLSPFLQGKEGTSVARSLYCESHTPTRYGAGALRGLVGERWKFIRAVRPELYDLSKDGGEATNMAPSEPAVVAGEERKLSALLARTAVGRAGKAASPDSEAVRSLAALGYLTGGADEEPDAGRPAADPKDLIDVHVLHTRAIQLIAGGRFAEAEPFARRCLERLPMSWEAHLTMGKVALGRGEWARAIPLFEKSLDLKPAQFEALMGMGRAYQGVRRFDRAAETFRRALPLDAEPPRAQFLLAGALIDLGSPGEAERLVVLGAPHAERKAALLLELGSLLGRLGHRAEAAAVLGRALDRARAEDDAALAARIEESLRVGGGRP